MVNTNQPSDHQFKVSRRFRTFFSLGMTIVVGSLVLIVCIFLIAVLFDVAREGIKAISWNSLTELPPPPGLSGGGFGNAAVGTVITLGIATAISAPIGILGGIYLAEFGQGTRLAYLIKFCANVLSGVPAILCGLFAYSLVVLTMGSFSALAGGVGLSALMIPIALRTTEEGLLLVPRDIRQAGLAMGATKFQVTVKVVLPAALPSIMTGVVLSLARAGGEAAPLLFTALNNNFWSTEIDKPIATLPILIYRFAIVPYEPQQELAWAAALFLIGMILILSILARWFSSQQKV